MTYREHAPHAALARRVECYWTIRTTIPPDAAPLRARVLPDGCMDIIVPLGDPVDPAHGRRATPFAVGTMTRPLEVAYSGAVDLLGVRFRPGGATPWISVDAAALTDDSVELDTLWNGASADLADRLHAARTAAARVEVLDEVLLRWAGRSRASADEAVLRAAELAAGAARRTVTVEAMAEAVGLGRRQLERRFRATVGVSPRTVLRVARFRRAVAILHAEPGRPLTSVALRSGYADQPHLTREFGAFAHTTPHRYRRGAGDAFVQDGGAPRPLA